MILLCFAFSGDGKTKTRRMNTSQFYLSFKRENLPLMNLFIIIVDVVIAFTLLLKSDEMSKIRDGDKICMVVVALITIGILVADVYYFVGKRQKDGDVDFTCSICSESTQHRIVIVKCEHAIRDNCIGESMDQMMFPSGQSPLHTIWLSMFKNKILSALNWRQLARLENNHSTAPVSIV